MDYKINVVFPSRFNSGSRRTDAGTASLLIRDIYDKTNVSGDFEVQPSGVTDLQVIFTRSIKDDSEHITGIIAARGLPITTESVGKAAIDDLHAQLRSWEYDERLRPMLACLSGAKATIENLDELVKEIQIDAAYAQSEREQLTSSTETSVDDRLKFVTTASMRIAGCGEFHANAGNAELVRLALNSFGHVIATLPNTKHTFEAFADAIAKVYDTSTPQTAAVVNALKEVHAQNKQALSIQDKLQDMSRETIIDLLDEALGVAPYDDKDDEELRALAFSYYKAGRLAVHDNV